LAATAVPVTFSTTAVTGATKVVTGVTSKSITYAYDVSSASCTLGTVTTKKFKVSVPKDTWVTGVNYSKATAATATGGAATVGSTTVYGV
jgi:anionic cell wall polymer biosynthesis LytR-Cps2A-Psr (LCP) family protein